MDWKAQEYAKKHPHLKRIQIKCTIRKYTYVAFLDKKTGQLKAVSAGCRKWANFRTAFAHYEAGRFSEGMRTISPLAAARLVNDLGQPYFNAVHRFESKRVLEKLKRKVEAYQAKVKRHAAR